MFVFAIEPAIKYKIPNNVKKLEGLINVFKKTHFSKIRSV